MLPFGVLAKSVVQGNKDLVHLGLLYLQTENYAVNVCSCLSTLRNI